MNTLKLVHKDHPDAPRMFFVESWFLLRGIFDYHVYQKRLGTTIGLNLEFRDGSKFPRLHPLPRTIELVVLIHGKNTFNARGAFQCSKFRDVGNGINNLNVRSCLGEGLLKKKIQGIR